MISKNRFASWVLAAGLVSPSISSGETPWGERRFDDLDRPISLERTARQTLFEQGTAAFHEGASTDWELEYDTRLLLRERERTQRHTSWPTIPPRGPRPAEEPNPLRPARPVEIEFNVRGVLQDDYQRPERAGKLLKAFESVREFFGEEGTLQEFQFRHPDRFNFDHTKLGGVDEHDRLILDKYKEALSSKNEAELLGYFASLRGDPELDTQDKLTLVQMFGMRYLQSYDSRRNRRGIRAHGVVTGDQLLEVAQHNTKLGFFGGAYSVAAGEDPDNPPPTEEQFAGVCRDITSAQARMAEALGFKNVKVKIHVPDHGIYHTTLLMTDPRNSRRVHNIDYYARRTRDGLQGADALFEGDHDFSLLYILAEPGGDTGPAIPSTFYQAMTELGGNSITELDPLLRPTYSIISGGVRFGSSDPEEIKPVRIVLFGMKDQAPGIAGGMALSYRYLMNSYFPGQVSLVLGTQQRTRTDVNHDFAFMQVNQKAVTPTLTFANERFELHGEAQVIAAAMVSGTRHGEHNGNMGVQGDVRLGAQLILHQLIMDKKGRITYRVGAQGAPGLSNIQDLDSIQPQLNHIFGSVGIRAPIFQSEEEARTYLIAEATVVYTYLGSRGRIEAGVVREFLNQSSIGALMNLEGRLDEKTPPYEYGSNRSIGLNVFWEPTPGILLKGFGTYSLEKESAGTEGESTLGLSLEGRY